METSGTNNMQLKQEVKNTVIEVSRICFEYLTDHWDECYRIFFLFGEDTVTRIIVGILNMTFCFYSVNSGAPMLIGARQTNGI